jgi:hypothetical protein
MNHYIARHAKVVPFQKTATFRALALAAAAPTAAGVIATGGAVATHHLAVPALPGAHYGVPADDHADPYHSDPGGEWIRIENAPTIGTASVHRLVFVPSA